MQCTIQGATTDILMLKFANAVQLWITQLNRAGTVVSINYQVDLLRVLFFFFQLLSLSKIIADNVVIFSPLLGSYLKLNQLTLVERASVL